MNKTMYAAKWKYGPDLARVEIAKETPKTFTVESAEILAGYCYFGKRTSKEKYSLFDTMAEALAWLLEKARKDYHRQQEAALKACAVAADLELALEAAQEHAK